LEFIEYINPLAIPFFGNYCRSLGKYDGWDLTANAFGVVRNLHGDEFGISGLGKLRGRNN
jgi:hypothetical protein